MVEKLAVMQRQYVDWGEDLIEVGKEMEIVKNYMDLQQYRFGKDCHIGWMWKQNASIRRYRN